MDHIQKQHKDWKKHCAPGETICYFVAELEDNIRDTEAAMIFTCKPVCNSNDIDKYNGETPAPNVKTDLSALPDITGELIDMLLLNDRLDNIK